jgi:cytochrome c556
MLGLCFDLAEQASKCGLQLRHGGTPSPQRGEGASRIRRNGLPSICVVTLFLCAATLIAAHAEQRVPGLTAIDHAADVVQARQLLMTQIDEDMQLVDLAAGGKDFPLDELKSNANRISIMLGAFPHLFPAQTKPGPDTFSTAAAPAIWQDFEAFYGQTDAATKLAYDASQATAIEQFRDSAKKLRAACDGCHAKYMKVDSPTPP